MSVDVVDDSHPVENFYFMGDDSSPNPRKGEASVHREVGA
jgi:hypothetical protein